MHKSGNESPRSQAASVLQLHNPMLSWEEACEEVATASAADASAAATSAAATSAAATSAAATSPTTSQQSSKRHRSTSPNTPKGGVSDESDESDEPNTDFHFLPRTPSFYTPRLKKPAYADTPRATASKDDDVFLVSTPRFRAGDSSSSPSASSSARSSPSPAPLTRTCSN